MKLFDVNVLMMDLFLTNTQIFASQDVNWKTGVVWIIVMFLSAVWTLILPAPIHCRGSIGEQVMKRSLHTEFGMYVCNFFFFRIHHPFLSKCLIWMRKHRKSNLVRFFFYYYLFILWRMKVLEAVCQQHEVVFIFIFLVNCFFN